MTTVPCMYRAFPAQFVVGSGEDAADASFTARIAGAKTQHRLLACNGLDGRSSASGQARVWYLKF